MIIFLITVLAVVVLLLLAAIANIKALQKELVELSKEQHSQNMDILQLIKYKQESSEMILQHIEILKYLCEKDPLLGRLTMPYTGPIGEA